ncbi:MAG TPA: PIG-L family deacetylase [Candidatus Kapabacteria bacterium]|nr:PIG-L family deacetylase [Candidatus Kapabacteria bacterium]
MKLKLLLSSLFLLFIYGTLSAQPANKSRFVVMCLAAHPDDETGAALAYCKDMLGAKTYSVFFTRGEGGQNEIGPELYKELAILRTHETENASAIVGSTPYFLNFPDFGYSKTASETYGKWGGTDEVLRRLVYIIRALKPDVIISNHNVMPSNGENHGNHQVVALTALEAFSAAADPKYHPEQFNDPGIAPWQVKKMYFRDWTRTNVNTHNVPENEVRVPISEIDPLQGKSFMAIAHESLSEHKTQGMGLTPYAAPSDAHIDYTIMQEDGIYPDADSTFFSGLTPQLKRTNDNISLPQEFTSLDYLNAEEPKPNSLPHVATGKNIFIGIVQSYDNTLAKALGDLHISYMMLDSSALAHVDLGKFTTILVDIRSYAKRPDLVASNNRLLDYTHNGGNLIVFYQKNFDWKPEYAPYPLTITRDRVTYEDAPVSELQPQDKLFHAPNEIGVHDWDGWVQERGLYFPAPSKNYTELLSMGDPGEKPLPTGLLMAHYGSGTYWYCCLSLYRQLQINNEGAFKLFANLISYNVK